VRNLDRPLLLLGLGAAIGLALAAAGIVGSAVEVDGLPGEAVARVNGVLVRADDYRRLVSGLESDLRRATDADERRRVLDRMVDEELLVQRGLELGLARYDRRVRADLVSSVIAAVTSDAEEREPSEAELREFYAEQRDFFTQPGRLRVRQIFFRVPMRATETGERAAVERAAAARERLARGEAFETVRRELGDPEILPVPDAPLPAAKLREYLGPTALRAALDLEVGGASAPVRSGTGVHVIELVDREPDRTPPYAELAPQVRSEWRRRSGERALRAYLDDLRRRADVELAAIGP
jgi:parvulin-like peptidyl-prolyl isomerase